MMAALRRHRFNIPIEYTLVYLENELIKTIKNNVSTQADFLLSITFIKHQENILFIISATNILPFLITFFVCWATQSGTYQSITFLQYGFG